MHRHASPRPSRLALFAAIGLLLVLPAVVAAHAEFARSTPANEETVEGSPSVIRAFFSEELADGSEMALLDEDGRTVAEGTIDPANRTRMRIDPPTLEPGDYEVQWKAFADDGHLETGTFAFTVSAAITPPPSLGPTPTGAATEEPPASVPAPPASPEPPAPSPSPAEEPANAAGTSDVLLPILGAVVLVGVLGGYLVMRRRPSGP